jgi:hypothetical protein
MHTEMEDAIASLHTMRLPSQPPRRWQRKTVELLEPRRIQRWRKVWVGLQEIAFLAIALDLGFLAWYYLSQWSIYRFIAYIIIVILWSNFASVTARTATRKHARRMLHTISMPAIRPRSQSTIPPDTMTFLKSLRWKVERRRQ